MRVSALLETFSISFTAKRLQHHAVQEQTNNITPKNIKNERIISYNSNICSHRAMSLINRPNNSVEMNAVILGHCSGKGGFFFVFVAFVGGAFVFVSLSFNSCTNCCTIF